MARIVRQRSVIPGPLELREEFDRNSTPLDTYGLFEGLIDTMRPENSESVEYVSGKCRVPLYISLSIQYVYSLNSSLYFSSGVE